MIERYLTLNAKKRLLSHLTAQEGNFFHIWLRLPFSPDVRPCNFFSSQRISARDLSFPLSIARDSGSQSQQKELILGGVFVLDLAGRQIAGPGDVNQRSAIIYVRRHARLSMYVRALLLPLVT